MKYFLPCLLLLVALMGAIGLADTTQAQENPFNIEFPIPELGNCESTEDCRNYCDDPAHRDACSAWAREHGFAKEERERSDVPPEGGPGGCLSENECRAYCEAERNYEECTNWAVEHGHMSAEEAKRFREAHERTGPGGCRDSETCDAYCRNPANQEECIDFAVREGYMTTEEAEQVKAFLRGEHREGDGRFDSRDIGPHPDGPDGDIDVEKARALLAERSGPGGCETFEECDAYCSTPQNSEACFAFAVEHGLIDSADAEKIKRIMNTEGPGGCRGIECKEYCERPGHERECLDFAIEHGLIPPEDAARAKRFLEIAEEGGPGGCRGRECDAYCSQPENRDECFAFAKEHGLISEEEIERIEKFKHIDEKVRNSGGPGGCRGDAECHEYCSDPAHREECVAFAVEEGFLSQEEAERELERFIEGGPLPPTGGLRRDMTDEIEAPRFERIPSEFRDREEEYNRRLESFEMHEDDLSAPADFPGEFNTSSSGDDEAHVNLTKSSSGGFNLVITDRQGIKRFEFAPSRGVPFSGDLACAVEYKSRTDALNIMTFPLKGAITDCRGNTIVFTIPALGNFDSFAPLDADVQTEGDPFLRCLVSLFGEERAREIQTSGPSPDEGLKIRDRCGLHETKAPTPHGSLLANVVQIIARLLTTTP